MREERLRGIDEMSWKMRRTDAGCEGSRTLSPIKIRAEPGYMVRLA